MKEKTFISIVIYTHNDERNIFELVVEIDKYLNSEFDNFEIIIVDDNSEDATTKEIRNVVSTLSRDITVIHLAWKHGPEQGMAAGIDLAIGDFVIEIDASKVDFDLNLFKNLLEEASRGYDIVSAVKMTNKKIIKNIFERESKGSGIFSAVKMTNLKISEAAFFNFFNSVTYLPFNVINEPVRIVSRRAINSITGMEERVILRGVLYKYSGFPNKIIEYEPINNKKIKSTSLREKIRLAFDALVSYSNIGINLPFIFSILFAFVSFLLGVYALLLYSTSNVVPGWTTTIFFMSICFMGVFIAIGLQGRYISIIISDIKKRPSYTVGSIERSSRQVVEAKK